MKRQFGLIGYPLSHTFSPSYFAKKYEEEGINDAIYKACPLEKIEMVEALFETHNGINVTIPYKEQVLPFLDELDEAAAKIGAVNTIKVENGRTKGFNTDVYGFEASLKPLLTPHHQKALVFGTGGASKAIVYVLEHLNIPHFLVSRKPKSDCITYEDISEDLAEEYKLLINTTPLGMSPNVNQAVLFPYNRITDKHLLYDLIYNPEETLFLKKGREKNATTKNGLEMLHLQAEKSWQIWNNK